MLLKIRLQSIFTMLVTLIILLSMKSFAAEPVTISSTQTPTSFLEVYTSQGCSSCPPAERWLSQFTDNKNLWKSFIPLNFHVDYWDYLGWKDPFALATFSQRQRTYSTLGKTRIVATPGFMVDGKGWQGWFHGRALPQANTQSPSTLTATINENKVKLNVDLITENELVAHVALLGFGIETQVKSGENRKRLLKHDFVVIGYQQGKMKADKKFASIDFTLPIPVKVATTRTAVVFWVSKKDDPTPIQVAADWL